MPPPDSKTKIISIFGSPGPPSAGVGAVSLLRPEALATDAAGTMAQAATMDLPSVSLCPISLTIMKDPVLCAGDGNTYERAWIESWIACHTTSPTTGLPLESTVLTPNRAAKGLIDALEEIKGSRTDVVSISADSLRLNTSASKLATAEEKVSAPLYSSKEDRPRAMLGSGRDKTGYRGFWRDADVAVLQIRRGGLEDVSCFTLMNRHPHIVRVLGLAEEHPGAFALVTERLCLGPLDAVLDKVGDELRESTNAAECSRMQVAAAEQVCSAMVCVASLGLVHRGLALRNGAPSPSPRAPQPLPLPFARCLQT